VCDRSAVADFVPAVIKLRRAQAAQRNRPSRRYRRTDERGWPAQPLQVSEARGVVRKAREQLAAALRIVDTPLRKPRLENRTKDSKAGSPQLHFCYLAIASGFSAVGAEKPADHLGLNDADASEPSDRASPEQTEGKLGSGCGADLHLLPHHRCRSLDRATTPARGWSDKPELMRAAFVTIDDPFDATAWSGINRSMALALEKQDIELDYIGPLRDPYRTLKRARRALDRALGRSGYLPDRSHLSARSFASQIGQRLRYRRPDLVFATGTIPIAFLETDIPIAFWTDANFASMLDFYPSYSGVSGRSVTAGNEIEARALDRAALAIYSSDWAARTAVDNYGVDAGKVAVVPFGPNLVPLPDRAAVEELVEQRPSDSCRLLFLGVDWERKGGKTAVATARSLNESGRPTTLVVVGSEVPERDRAPFVNSRGFIDKTTESGRTELSRLLAETHLLVHPARADATPVALAEANAFGIPVLAADVGGISTIVQEGRNGHLLAAGAGGDAYAEHVRRIMDDHGHYRRFALDAHDVYARRLNWHVAGASVATRLAQLTG
jgi:glycosyltransferase involved in cell wall biosynthesis